MGPGSSFIRLGSLQTDLGDIGHDLALFDEQL